MKRTTISLPDSLVELLTQEARRRETSVSEVIRGYVEKGLGGTKEHPRVIPWAGLFDDPGMVPGEAIDGALRAHWADDLDRDRG
jgi:hypothetical protein